VAVIRAARFWLCWLPAALAPLCVLYESVAFSPRLIDLHFAFLPAARAVLDGRSPYAGAYALLRRRIDSAYVYPPPTAFLMIPFTAFSSPVAAVVFTLLGVASAAALLWLMGVRDCRCYALVLVAHPVFAGELVGALSLMVAAIAAAAWRWRNSPVVVGLLVALAIVTKLFCWPLLLWLAATRRFRAAGLGVLAGAGCVFGTWAVIGFAGFGEYRHLLSWVTAYEFARSYSVAALLHYAGIPLALGQVVGVVAGVVLVVAVVSRRRDDAGVFLAAVAAALLASPIVWDHYFVLLVIPCAIARPRFSFAWLLLLGGWAPVIIDRRADFPVTLPCVVMYDLIAVALFAWALNESRGSEGLQSSPPRFDSDPRRRVER
jgi:alpha-1,2-mannosyltransferase